MEHLIKKSNKEKVLELITKKLENKYSVKLSNEYIAKKTGLTLNQVVYNLQKLRQEKLIGVMYKNITQRTFFLIKTSKKIF